PGVRVLRLAQQITLEEAALLERQPHAARPDETLDHQAAERIAGHEVTVDQHLGPAVGWSQPRSGSNPLEWSAVEIANHDETVRRLPAKGVLGVARQRQPEQPHLTLDGRAPALVRLHVVLDRRQA